MKVNYNQIIRPSRTGAMVTAGAFYVYWLKAFSKTDVINWLHKPFNIKWLCGGVPILILSV